ncbi:MAG: TonB-dependent receptor plug domain-containing protein [Bacteroidota bacterium]|nr:TonB-dependent receptor plug domain-containing protein [Bacteroidota bacterium]
MRKTGLLIIILLLTLTVRSFAEEEIRDTIHIPAIEVFKPRIAFFSEGSKKEQFDVHTMKSFELNSVNELLLKESALQLKSYGTPGSATTLSLRGAGANHTQVNWNGFPINSATLGESDLSFLPVGGFGSITLIQNASGALYGSGTFGGALNLENQTDWKDTGLNFRLSSGWGSLNTYQGNGIVHYGNKKIQYQGSFFGGESDGNFKYYDYYLSSTLRRQNAAWNNFGAINNVYFKTGDRSQIDAAVWYQVKDIKLPAIMGSALAGTETQKDSTLKTFVRYKWFGNASGLEIKAAYFFDYMLYTKKETAESAGYSIFSKYRTDRYFMDVDYRHFFTQNLSVDYGSTFSYLTAKVDAYKKLKQETDFAVFMAGKYKSSLSMAELSVRKEWNTSFDSKFLLSASGVCTIIEDHLHFRSSISQKFRKPTFNDLYWVPGGNPDLKPESGYSAEAGLIVDDLLSSKAQVLDLDLAVYFSDINNMIVWRPMGSLWTPVNFMKVYARGIELKTTDKFNVGSFAVDNLLSVNMNRSTQEKTKDNDSEIVGHDLFYMPLVSTFLNSSWSWNNYTVSVSHHFTSSRYYDVDNKLPAFQTVDIMASHELKIGKTPVGIQVRVDNLFNKEYELVRSYPMPGRLYSMKIGIQII